MSILTYYINIDTMAEHNISLPEVLCLLALHYNNHPDQIFSALKFRGLIDDNNMYTTKGLELKDKLLGGSIEWSEEKLSKLAEQMKEIYPKGRKPGTAYYWSDGVSLITKRLRIFFKKYGEKYTEEQILNATRKYVESYSNDMQYMQLLKYFIFKEKINPNHELESQSDLLNYIENYNQEDEGSDWLAELV